MRIYLDNAATTQVDERVIKEMIPFMNKHYGNPSSIHYFSKKPKVLIEDAREVIADFIGAKPKEIFFTSGGTESINSAIKGVAFQNLSTNKNHIITTSVEHPAVLESVKYLEENFGFNVDYIKPGDCGRIDVEKIIEKINDETLLICLMHSNNETGVINEVEKISKITKSKNIYFLCDTVQSIGKTLVNVKKLGVSFATASAHKIYCLKGIGFLYMDSEIKLHKYMHGGGQERNMRAGTESIPMIAGLKKGIELIKQNFDTEILHYKNISKYLISQLVKNFGKDISFNSDKEDSLPNIVNVRFDYLKLNFDPELLLINLDLKGIAVSGGSACSSGSLSPSNVLIETGLTTKEALSSIRISVGRFNTFEDIDNFITVINEIIKK